MGKIYKFFESEIQHSGASPRFMYIDLLPEQEGELTYNGEEQFPAWKNLDPLKLLVEGEKSATDAGEHFITVTPMGNFAWPDNTQSPREISYTIKRKPLAAIPAQKNSLTFNNNQQTPTWYNYNSVELTIGGVYQNQTGAGTYTATFTPTSNYCWSDGTFATKNISWTIAKLKLSKPTASTTSYNYSGSEITLSVSNFNSTYMTQAGTTSATAIGNYSATYTLKSTADTCWSDGSTGTVTISWSITAVSVAKVTANTQTFTFNAANQEPTWLNYNSNYMTKSGDGAKTNSGTYSTTFTLKTGYTWNDGTNAAITITWNINKKSVTMPLPTAYSYEWNGTTSYPVLGEDTDKAFYTVTGQSKEVGTFDCKVTLKYPESSYWANNKTDPTYTITVYKKVVPVPTQSGTVEYDGTAYNPASHISWSGYNKSIMSISGNSQTNVGTYTATFTITNSNYCFSGNNTTATANWTISKATLNIPEIYWGGGYTYEETYQPNISYSISELVYGYESDKMTTGGSWSTKLSNVGSVTATLTPKANYQWSDGTTRAITYQYTVTKANSDFSSVFGSTALLPQYITTLNCGSGQDALHSRSAEQSIYLILCIPNGWTPTLTATGGWNLGSATQTNYQFQNQPSDCTNYYWKATARGSTSGNLSLTLKNSNYNDWTYDYGTVYGNT